MRSTVCALAVLVCALSGCSSSDTAGITKAAICTRALGVVVLSEASDDAQRRVAEAKNAATVLQQLSSQTADKSLSDALSKAASTAGEVTTHDFSPTGLKTWVSREQARFDALRKACV
ncbi:MAG TPA: hypothetical protein VH352_27730 [Pseudonocardiaceae bacterium]|nr:hypothetical protein [Pseudonocardiaceae bacterium]